MQHLDWEAEHESRIVAALREYASTGTWNSRTAGPRPDSPQCKIPARLFQAAGVRLSARALIEPAKPMPSSRGEGLGRDPRSVANTGDAIAAADRIERRTDRSAAEAQRVALARLEQGRAIKSRVRDELLHENGRTRMVKRVSTTAEKLVASGKLDRGLKATLEAFAMLVAVALGCATVDGDDASNRLTAGYEPTGGSGFGPRSVSDRRLLAIEALRKVRAGIPNELLRTFTEVAAEEVGSLIGKPRTLAQIGEARGYLHKQASSAGSVEVTIVVELIAHLVRQVEGLRAEIPDRGRMSQDKRKMLAHTGFLEEIAA